MHNRIGNWRIFIIIASIGLIQACGFKYLALSGAKPDILFCVVVFFSLFAQRIESIKAALLSGLIIDLTSSSIFGSYILSLLLLALILNHYQGRFYKDRIITQVIITFVLYLLMGNLVLLFNLIQPPLYYPYHTFLSIILKGAFYTALASPLIFFILGRLVFDFRIFKFRMF